MKPTLIVATIESKKDWKQSQGGLNPYLIDAYDKTQTIHLVTIQLYVNNSTLFMEIVPTGQKILCLPKDVYNHFTILQWTGTSQLATLMF